MRQDYQYLLPEHYYEQKQPSCFWGIILKMPYFQRKHIEKYAFPLVIATFLLYLQRILLNSRITIIIGRENEQRELCKLHGSSILIRPRV